MGYRPYADNEATGTRGHGPRVVGSILGESSTPAAAGATERGTAYKAKVSLTDILHLTSYILHLTSYILHPTILHDPLTNMLYL